ncbi:glycoside hydrolase family 5 protein [bacterium]|nr:glycoside hydrolase family 5 protein [bacterium]
MKHCSLSLLLSAMIIFLVFPGCDSSEIEDALDLADGVPRRTIDTSRLGMNAFVNDARFGTVGEQFREVRDTLGLNFVRVLLVWNEAVQPAPGGRRDFSFYDSIIESIPAGMDALVILTGIPSWMSDSANWTDGSPRTTFVEQWVRPAVRRYGGNGRVIGFQIWNEPNMVSNGQNATLDVLGNEGAVNYVEMLARAANVVRENAPGKLVVNAASTAIAQNFSETLDYNRAMRDAGIYEFIDIFAIHYYGKQFENLVRSGGVRGFLNSVPKPIWVTETGAQGVNEQLPYGEEVWPYLREQIPGIDRIYVYQFTDADGPGSYGLRNPSADFPVSDLYLHLRDRANS